MRSHFYKRRIITAFPSGNIISIWEKHSAKICCDPEKNLSACTDRAVLPSMKRLGGGRIVNSTSSSVKDCLDNLILSNTMRMGVVGMSKTLAREVGKDNILINVIGPGRIGTARIESLNKMRADKAGISVSDYEKEDLKKFPMARYGTIDEYGRLATWLCSEANTYVSGQTILLDGAMTTAY